VLTVAAAGERMLELVRARHVDESRLEADASERRRRGITFRELRLDDGHRRPASARVPGAVLARELSRARSRS
jgi:hypothetical protein